MIYTNAKDTKFEIALADLPDAELVRHSKKGNRAAFGALLRRYQDRIFNTAYRFSGNWHDAEEITQRAFINAYKGLKQFRGDSAFSTWLYRIAFNAGISLIREEKKLKTVLINSNLL